EASHMKAPKPVGNEGFGLVHVLVIIGVMSIVLMSTSTFLENSMKVNSKTKLNTEESDLRLFIRDRFDCVMTVTNPSNAAWRPPACKSGSGYVDVKSRTNSLLIASNQST